LPFFTAVYIMLHCHAKKKLLVQLTQGKDVLFE